MDQSKMSERKTKRGRKPINLQGKLLLESDSKYAFLEL